MIRRSLPPGLSILILALLVGCSSPSSPSELNPEALLQENVTLHHQRNRLLSTLDRRDEKLNNVARLVQKMVEDVQTVALRDDLVRGPVIHKPVGIHDGFGHDAQSVALAEQQFTAALAAIESHLRDTDRKVERVRSFQMQEVDIQARVTPLRTALQGAEATLSTHRALLSERGLAVDSLQTLSRRLHVLLDEVMTENEALAARAEEAEAAFVTIGSGDALEAAGVIEQKFLRSPRVTALPADAFDRVDVATHRIALPPGRSVKVASPHRDMASLYTLSDDALHIHDPAAFWAWSRYLVLVTD